MKLLLVLLLLVISVNLTAQGERWVHYGTNGDGDEYFYDKETLEYNTSTKNDWIKIIFKNHLFNNYLNKYEKYNLLHIEFYCSDRTYRNKEFIIYYDDGTNSYYDQSDKTEFKTVIPDTINESLFYIICQ